MSTLVGQIVDQLTDAITELTDIVVLKKKENAQVPQGLDQLVEHVCKAADVLINVARDLATSEYVDFPEIASDITSAANNVQSANNNLRKSVRELMTTTNRANGWANLADSCSIIAKQTVTLLEIVYGAEVKKTYELAMRTKKGIRKALDSVDDVSGPDSSNNNPGGSGGNNNPNSNYGPGNNRGGPGGNNNNGPYGNNNNNNPGNRNSGPTSQVSRNPGPGGNNGPNSNYGPGGNNNPNSPGNNRGPGGSNNPSGGNRGGGNDPYGNNNPSTHPRSGAPFDPQKFADEVSKTSGDLGSLANLLRDAAKLQTAPTSAIKLNRLAGDLDNASGKYVDKANDVLKNPKDQRAQDAFRAEADRADGLIDQATQVLHETPVFSNPDQNNPKAERALRDLQNLLSQIPIVSRAAAERPNDPAARKNLNDLLDQLEQLMAQVPDNNLNPELAATKKKAAAILAKMRPAKKSGDWQKTLLDASGELANTLAQLIAEAKTGAHQNSLDGKTDVNSLLRDLDALDAQVRKDQQGTQVAGVMGDVARSLDKATKQSKQQLARKDPNDPMIKSYEALSNSFAKLAEAASSGDGSAMIAAAKEIQAEIRKLKAETDKVAKNCRNTAEQEKLYNMSASLENFGIQLKIMAAVKAGSAKGDRGNDTNLMAVTKNMGTALESILSTSTAAKLQSK